MYILATCLLVAGALSQEVYENGNDTALVQNANTTYLSPVGNKSLVADSAVAAEINLPKNVTKQELTPVSTNNDGIRFKNDATSWNIDATYSEPNKTASYETDINTTADSKEVEVFKKPEDKAKNIDTPFKPSPVLDSFYDLDDFAKPPSIKSHDGFFSPIVSDFRSKNKFNEESTLKYSTENKVVFPSSNDDRKNKGKHPYKFERQVPEGFHKWRSNQPDSKPTVAFPVSIPAGGLYKIPYAIHNEKPETFEREKEFDLFHGDGLRVHKFKKPHSPWKGLLHLVTALLPVGLIVSALSPTLITIDSVQDAPGRLRKRSADAAAYSADSPPMEACKRRILCELYGPHTDSLAGQQVHLPVRHRSEQRGSQPCAQHSCADPRAMAKLVRWVRKQLTPARVRSGIKEEG